MKKLIAILLSCALVLSMPGCKKNDPNAQNNGATPTQTAGNAEPTGTAPDSTV